MFDEDEVLDLREEIVRLRAELAVTDGVVQDLATVNDELRAELAAERAQSVADCAYTDGLEAALARVREYVETEMNFDNAAYRIPRLLERNEK